MEFRRVEGKFHRLTRDGIRKFFVHYRKRHVPDRLNLSAFLILYHFPEHSYIPER